MMNNISIFNKDSLKNILMWNVLACDIYTLITFYICSVRSLFASRVVVVHLFIWDPRRTDKYQRGRGTEATTLYCSIPIYSKFTHKHFMYTYKTE